MTGLPSTRQQRHAAPDGSMREQRAIVVELIRLSEITAVISKQRKTLHLDAALWLPAPPAVRLTAQTTLPTTGMMPGAIKDHSPTARLDRKEGQAKRGPHSGAMDPAFGLAAVVSKDSS